MSIVAAPLRARSGVYRSSIETVTSAREQGLDWQVFLGVASFAQGEPITGDGVSEFGWEPGGLMGVRALARQLESMAPLAASDVIISMTPQCDMALALSGEFDFVSYLRGLPWPESGERSQARTFLWQVLERLALRRSSEIWTTTEQLASELPFRTILVPPGIAALGRTWDGRGERSRAVWAARFDIDKNPGLFAEALRGSPLTGAMYGVGPESTVVADQAPANVSIQGWTDSGALFVDALAYVGTSWREAFGRSAVEAAMRGIPVVVSDRFGCAEMLYTDPDLRRRFVLDPNLGPARWRDALADLAQDEGLRVAVSDHLVANAAELTVDRSVHAIQERLERRARTR